MSVKDIFAAAFNKDASSFETAFSSVMKEKVIAAVENKFFAVEEYELDESKYEDDEDEDEEDEEVELDESWSDGISSRNAHMHASTAAKYRKKANDSATMAKNYDKGSLDHNKNMANYHSAMAKSIKSSYHAGDYGSLNTAKRDHKAQMDKSKEYKSLMSEEVELDEVSADTLASYMSKANVSRAKAMGSMRNTAGGMDFALHKKRLDKRDAGIKTAVSKYHKKLNDNKINANEEVEELDELSKKTLGSYTKAAANDIGHLQRDITNREPGYKGLQAKRNNRRDGIERAVDRLTKEEAEELDEAAKPDYEYKDEAIALLKKVEDKNIKVIFKDRFVRGMKAQGPSKPNKANVAALKQALQDGEPVQYWRS